ncbi:hypothetical protein ACS0TY_020825 [Phlomoides rotata]
MWFDYLPCNHRFSFRFVLDDLGCIKAYVQQLENSKLRLLQLEQELDRAGQQGLCVGGVTDTSQFGYSGNTNSGIATFEMEFGQWSIWYCGLGIPLIKSQFTFIFCFFCHSLWIGNSLDWTFGVFILV